MEVQIEAPGGLRRQLRVRIPAARVAEAVDERLKKLSARAKVPGFRPGKVPMKVMQQQYGATARLDAVSDLVQHSFPEALGQAGVNPAGMPKIDITSEEPGEPLEYVADFEVFPEIKLAGLDALHIEKPTVTIGDADIDRLIENLRSARRTTHPVDRAAQGGDVVQVDFEGTIDGEAFPGSKAEDAEFEIGAGRFLPDLEQGVIGHGAGERFTLEVRFPEDYRAELLRGKTARFEVTLKGVQEVQWPAVEDEEFLKAHGAASVDDLRAKSRTALENEAQKAVRNRVKTQVLDQLLAANPIDVPQALVDQEVARLRDETASRINLPNVAAQREKMLPAALFEEAAMRRVALGLLVGEVIKEKAVSLDPQRVERALEDLANDFEQPEELKAYYRSQPEMMRKLRASVLEDQVVDVLLGSAAVTEQPTTLEQLLGQRG